MNGLQKSQEVSEVDSSEELLLSVQWEAQQSRLAEPASVADPGTTVINSINKDNNCARTFTIQYTYF